MTIPIFERPHLSREARKGKPVDRAAIPGDSESRNPGRGHIVRQMLNVLMCMSAGWLISAVLFNGDLTLMDLFSVTVLSGSSMFFIIAGIIEDRDKDACCPLFHKQGKEPRP